MSRSVSSAPKRLPRRAAGFAMIEILVAGAILLIALLGYAASVSAGSSLAVSVEERGLAVQTLQRFVEKLRADSDWGGLYARLCAGSKESTADTSLAWHKVDLSLSTYSATAYYSDFESPSSLGTVTFLVQVPLIDVGGVKTLRESASASRYGLPADLNGDGTIDSASRADDYRVLPMVVRMRWQRSGRQAQEVVLATWLRGDR